jgi:surface antigen
MTWLTLHGPWLCRIWSSADPSSLYLASVFGPQTRASGQLRRIAPDGSAANATVHCTRAWFLDADGQPFSAAQDWVPTTSDGSDVSRQRAHTSAHPAALGALAGSVRLSAPAPSPATPSSWQPTGGYDPWGAVPGHPGYAMSDFAGDPYSQYFGVCTWYAWSRAQSEPLMRLGGAAQWAWNAGGFGLRTGSTPSVGATAVFQPGVEGAGGGGHVAHVEAVLGGGWFIVSEMNFGLNGGGWGRVDWRYAYTAPGVSFIY